MGTADPWHPQAQALGAFIRNQRRLADFSLRELAALTDVSNAYLSQVERGLHQPSVRVLTAIAQALHVSVEELLGEAGLRSPTASSVPTPAASTPVDEAPGSTTTSPATTSTVAAIEADPRLTPEQRRALIGVYRSFVPADEGHASASGH